MTDNREQRIEEMRARRHTAEWDAAGARLMGARHARLVALREAEAAEHRQNAIDALSAAGDYARDEDIAMTCERINQAISDARSDFPDVSEDDVAHDMTVNVIVSLPSTRRWLGCAVAVARTTLCFTPAETFELLRQHHRI